MFRIRRNKGGVDMGIPQIIIICLFCMSFGIVLAKNGEPRDSYNAGISFLSLMMELGLLYWGGFFN
jgi:hypothetical protein